MKLYLATILLVFTFLVARPQTPTNALNSTGNAGIGTTSPAYPLEINTTGLISRLGGDPSSIGIGTLGTNSVNSFVGGYNSGAGGYPTSYLSSNIYYTNSGWISPDNSKSTSMLMLQSGNLYFLTAPPGGGYGSIKMAVGNGGAVGIGTSSPVETLTIAQPVGTGYSPILSLNELTNNGSNSMGIDFKFAGLSGFPWGATGRLEVGRQSTSANFDMIFHTATNGVLSEKMRILNNGNIGIGKSAPNTNAKLDVNGNIYCNSKIFIGTPDANTLTQIAPYALAVNGTAVFTKAKVSLYGNWPDYVFSPAYKIIPLDSLEQFIQLNKHLPEVPSATDVEKNGIDLGDNQALLLKKIEELTLIVIQQNKKIKEQNKRIEKLETRVN